MPTSVEVFEKPHALYRLFDRAGTLLYLGCSMVPFRRLQQHLWMQPWHLDIFRIELEWCSDWYAGRTAEMTAIQRESPLYNRLVHDPSAVGTSTIPSSRGDGLHCPKCGAEKAKRRNAYCPPCTVAYRRERKIALGWTPLVREPPTCPRCEGPRVPGRSYCDPCRSIVNKEGRARRLAAAEKVRRETINY